MNAKNTKAVEIRNKESYIQAVNARFGFKVEGEGTYVWTEGTNNFCTKLPVKSYELVASGNNNFWVVKTLEGKTLVICEVEYTTNYYYRARTAKAKAGDFKVPHLCYGYWEDFNEKVKEIEENDLAEMEAEGDTDSFYRWLVDRNALLNATYN